MEVLGDPLSPRKKQKLDLDSSSFRPQNDVSSSKPGVAQLDGTDEGSSVSEATHPTGHTTDSGKVGISKHEKELSVSIAAFVQPNTLRISGVAKKRYTDFLVNEILPSGEVVHLRELSLPKSPVQQGSRVPGNARSDLQAEPLLGENVHSPNGRLSAGVQEQVEPTEPTAPDANSQLDTSARGRLTSSGDAPKTYKSTLESSHVESSTSSGLGPKQDEHATPAHSAGESAPNGTEEAGLARWQAFANQVAVSKLPEKDRVYLGQFFTPEAIEKAEALYNRVLASPGRSAAFYGAVDLGKVKDKATRSVIHQAIRQIFRERLESSAEQNGMITLRYNTPNMPGCKDRHNQSTRGGRSARGGKNANQSKTMPGSKHSNKSTAPQDKPAAPFLHFSLLKENRDTLEVVSFLSRQLRKTSSDFQFAGTKDRRAVTVQRISGPAYLYGALKRMSSGLRTAYLGNFEYSSSSLELGELTGNEFVMTIRDLHVDGLEGASPESQVALAQDRVTTAMSTLAQHGFINYFGLQRFGTFAKRTDMIGMKLLMQDFKGVIDDVLDVHPSILGVPEDDNSVSRDERLRAEAIHFFRNTGNGKFALDILPRRFSGETSLIRHLTSHPERSNDWAGAVSSIARTQRMLYLHAFQSHIWNIVATHRWNLHGDRVVEGDLVLENSSGTESNAPAKQPRSGLATAHVDADGEVIMAPAAHDRAAPTQDRGGYVRPLSADDIASNKYSIFDVILPLPGQQMTYPPNLMDFYARTMREERFGGLDLHTLPARVQGISIGGGYRALLARPSADWDARVVAYDGEDRQLVMTDKDRLIKEGKLEAPKPKEGVEVPKNWPVELEGEFDDKGLPIPGPWMRTSKLESDSTDFRLAAVLRMQLGSGTYATMALRELSKGGIRMYEPPR